MRGPAGRTTGEAGPPGGRPEFGPSAPLLERPELKLAVFYVLVASLWVMFSDLLLVELVQIPVESMVIHTFKGVNIAATTGVLFFVMLRRAYGGWRRSEAKRLAELAASNDRFRSLSSRIQALREEERTNIAREVHDELGQLLTGVKLKLRMVEGGLDGIDDRRLNPQIEELVEAGEMIDETINAVRRIATGLRPATLDHLGLMVALEEEASQFTRRSGIECRVDVERMELPVPEAIATAAFRVCQECLTNVIRHSGASRVDLVCETPGDELILRVNDNGMGCDSAVLSDPRSLGLIGMRERAEHYHGRLEILSVPDEGTSVTICLPLHSQGETPTQLKP